MKVSNFKEIKDPSKQPPYWDRKQKNSGSIQLQEYAIKSIDLNKN